MTYEELQEMIDNNKNPSVDEVWNAAIEAAAEAAGISYMVMYMRLRAGKPVARAMKKPVRAYNKKVA